MTSNFTDEPLIKQIKEAAILSFRMFRNPFGEAGDIYESNYEVIPILIKEEQVRKDSRNLETHTSRLNNQLFEVVDLPYLMRLVNTLIKSFVSSFVESMYIKTCHQLENLNMKTDENHRTLAVLVLFIPWRGNFY